MNKDRILRSSIKMVRISAELAELFIDMNIEGKEMDETITGIVDTAKDITSFMRNSVNKDWEVFEKILEQFCKKECV